MRLRMRQGIVLAAATSSLSEFLFLKTLPFSTPSAVSFRRLSASPLPTPSPLRPNVPLFLRPPKHAGTLSDLRQWHAWAKRLATSVGSSFVLSDGGPNSTLLCRELGWLLEDVLDGSDIDPRLVDRASTEEDGQRKVRLRAQIEDLYRLWRQRIEGRRPFQYVVGCEHWRDLVLWVREGVLIPRPETEVVIDLVVDAVGRNQALRDGLWADLGTGSGAIAIGVSRVLGNGGKVFATDLSEVALEVASYNVCRYGLQDVIELRKGSWLEPLKDMEGKLDGLVSNPPYIPSDDILGLQAEVGRHEPRLALDGGVDGTDDLVELCNGVASFLKPGGFFAFETNGEKQCQFIVEYLGRELKGRQDFMQLRLPPFPVSLLLISMKNWDGQHFTFQMFVAIRSSIVDVAQHLELASGECRVAILLVMQKMMSGKTSDNSGRSSPPLLFTLELMQLEGAPALPTFGRLTK